MMAPGRARAHSSGAPRRPAHGYACLRAARAWLAACLCCACCLVCQRVPAAAPAVVLERADAGLQGARVAPNLLLNLSLTHAAAAAAHGGDYLPQREYAGYFDARMCYLYPYRSKDGAMVPDLRVATAYFSVLKPADAQHGCGGDSFSGNFLNWASASMLDIVRYALTGGERVIDEIRKTVLQRAYLPDGSSGPDFFAHAGYFPRKVLRQGVATATPFALAQVAIVSCRNRLLFGDAGLPAGGSCDAPGAAGAHGVFLARVRVCDAAEGPLRGDLCLAYGKQYKPVGAVQRHGGRVRVGVFGLLNAAPADASPAYGGVLRAPLGHVGRQRWMAPDFVAQDNPGAEWHPLTGVYLKHDQDAGHGGGVTAYINGLGHSNPARLGAYAGAAPLAELLYESLRYLQGRQASPVVPPATAPPPIDDGLPVAGQWSDPQTASCQRHVVVSLGDAGMAADRYVPGNLPVAGAPPHAGDRVRPADAFAPPPLDAMAWTRAVGMLESGGAQGNPAPRPELSGLEVLASGTDGASYHAAGLAYWSHVQALRPGDKADNGSAATLAHYAGDLRRGDPAAMPAATPLLLAAKYGGFADTNGDANPFKSASGSALAEWSLDGGWPSHYLPGSDPVALIAGLRAAFAAADKGTRPSTLAGPALMALASGAEEAYWFQTQLRLADGSMSVSRYAFVLGADGALSAGKPLWRAGEVASATATDTPGSLRPVYTLDAQGASMPLLWKRLSPAQRSVFASGDGDGDGQGAAGGAARLEYVLGKRTDEVGFPGGFLRRRAGSLGAAPFGNLVYVGTPAPGMPGASYQLHRKLLQQRRKMLYLGANDGLLHAFDARTGSELFAYLPQALLRGVADAASTHYSPGPLLDGGAASAEVLALGHWKTVLVSGMGGGAQGVFALDITDPARFAQDGALWEFTDRDDKLIGNVRAPPAFARVNVGGKDGVPAYRDFAVVASGYNNDSDDGKETTAPAATAAIFLLALDKPVGTPWLLGSNYYRLKVPVANGGGDGGPAAGQDGGAVVHALGPPALVPGSDGALAYLYAGDLQGNIWRVDVSGGPPWKDGGGRKHVFVARDAQGRRQAVTQQIKVAYAPGGGYLLLFGTGKLVEAGDTWPGAFLSQAFYAVHDDLREQSPTRSRADLEPRSLGVAPDGLAVDGAEVRYTGSAAMRGWYLDFMDAAQTGERSVHSPVLAAGKVIFNTVLPGRAPCAGLATRLYALDVLSGFAADGAGLVQAGEVTGRLLDGLARAPPMVLELNATVGVATATGRAVARKELAVLQPGLPGTALQPFKVLSAPLPARRLSWREVANWHELHEAAKKKLP